MNDYEAGVIAAVVLVALVLVYRLLRREPWDRIVRMGLFIERAKYEPPNHQEPDTEEHPPDHGWPTRPPE